MHIWPRNEVAWNFLFFLKFSIQKCSNYVCVCTYVRAYMRVYVRAIFNSRCEGGSRTIYSTQTEKFITGQNEKKNLLKVQSLSKVLRMQAIRSKQLRNTYICYQTPTSGYLFVCACGVHVCMCIHTGTHTLINAYMLETRTSTCKGGLKDLVLKVSATVRFLSCAEGSTFSITVQSAAPVADGESQVPCTTRVLAFGVVLGGSMLTSWSFVSSTVHPLTLSLSLCKFLAWSWSDAPSKRPRSSGADGVALDDVFSSPDWFVYGPPVFICPADPCSTSASKEPLAVFPDAFFCEHARFFWLAVSILLLSESDPAKSSVVRLAPKNVAFSASRMGLLRPLTIPGQCLCVECETWSFCKPELGTLLDFVLCCGKQGRRCASYAFVTLTSNINIIKLDSHNRHHQWLIWFRTHHTLRGPRTGAAWGNQLR